MPTMLKWLNMVISEVRKMHIKFTIPGEPFGKLNMKPVIRAGHPTLVSPKNNVTYANRVLSCIMDQLSPSHPEGYQIDTPIFSHTEQLMVVIVAYFGLEKKHYGKKGVNKSGQLKLDRVVRPIKKPDCDNISKIVCDAITTSGMVWHDDSQIVHEIIEKVYDEIPRVEITVVSMPDL